MNRLRPALLGLAVAFAAAGAIRMTPAQEAAAPAPIALTVRGDVPKAGTVTAADLEALEPSTVTWKHNGKTYEFTGVPLDKLLVSRGLLPGDKLTQPKTEKWVGYKFVVVASSPDSYQAVYSFAELTATNGAPTKAYLVWKLDGKPLPADMGPLRLVSTTDGEGARSIYNLASLDVIDMRRIVKPEATK